MEWYQHLKKKLLRYGLKVSRYDPECFTMPGELRLIVLCHVDDLLIAGNEVDILIFKNYMQTNFEKITFEGNKNEIQYIGMIFKRYQDRIEVSQPGYLNEIIRRFKLKPEDTASSPATEKITEEPEEDEKIDVSEFRSKVMTIMFITRKRRSRFIELQYFWITEQIE